MNQKFATKVRESFRAGLLLLRSELTWTAIGTIFTSIGVAAGIIVSFYSRQVRPELSYFVVRTNEIANSDKQSIIRMTIGVENRSSVPAKNVDIAIRHIDGASLKIYSVHPTKRLSDDVFTLVTIESVPANTTALIEVQDPGGSTRREPLDLRIFAFPADDIQQDDERRQLHPLGTSSRIAVDGNQCLDVAAVHSEFGSVRKNAVKSLDALTPIRKPEPHVSSR